MAKPMNNNEKENQQITNLKDILDGKNSTMSKQLALKLYINSNDSGKEEFLSSLLEKNSTKLQRDNNGTVLSDMISLIHALEEINSTRAREVILKCSRTENEILLAAVLESLRGMGDEEYLSVALSNIDHPSGYVRKQAIFTASVISYRYNLRGNEFRRPKESDQLHPSGEGKNKIAILVDRSGVRDKYPSFLAKNYYDMKFAEDLTLIVRYSGNSHLYEFLVLFDKNLVADNFNQMFNRKMLMGVVVERIEETRGFDIGYLIFSSPVTNSTNEVDIIISDVDGNLCFSGNAELNNNAIHFSMYSLKDFGIPLEIKGKMVNMDLVVEKADFSTPHAIGVSLKPEP